MTFQQRNHLLNHYFFLSYLVVLIICSSYLKHISLSGPRTILYVTAVYLTYGFIYLLPALLLTKILCRIQHWSKKKTSLWMTWLTYATAVISISGSELLLLADSNIYNIYNFHLNGFVWNLITAPGGIESMGGSSSTNTVIAAIMLGIIFLQIVLLWLSQLFLRRQRKKQHSKPRRIYLYLLIIFIILSTGERITYGISQLQSYSPVIITSNAFPFYMPMTFFHLARKLGFNVHHEKNLHVTEDCKLRYPLKPLVIKKPAKLPNIVLLVSESLRWDMLDPEIMPAAWKFARQAHQFKHNYSAGNGTRMGVFGFFYGLYGPYWFPFLNTRQSPILMDTVQKLGYQISMYTSAKFSYPEFDQTILVNLPDSAIHEYGSKGPGWARDRKNVGDIIKFINHRDPKRPFFTFMFFESPHARYYFPPESVIRENYLRDFNYATMSLEKDIGLIKNRYINSCHHLDSQLQRIFDYLEREKLLNNTIVVLVGDHGEEFMEKGRWGHNSEFHEEQTRTPLILWVPGTGSSTSNRITSHLDIVPTLMPLLGVTNPPADYSLGHNLLGNYHRKYTVIGDWSRLAYVSKDFKIVFPYRKVGFTQITVTTRDDREIEDAKDFLAGHKDIIPRMMRELNLFKQQRKQ